MLICELIFFCIKPKIIGTFPIPASRSRRAPRSGDFQWRCASRCLAWAIAASTCGTAAARRRSADELSPCAPTCAPAGPSLRPHSRPRRCLRHRRPSSLAPERVRRRAARRAARPTRVQWATGAPARAHWQRQWQAGSGRAACRVRRSRAGTRLRPAGTRSRAARLPQRALAGSDRNARRRLRAWRSHWGASDAGNRIASWLDLRVVVLEWTANIAYCTEHWTLWI